MIQQKRVVGNAIIYELGYLVYLIQGKSGKMRTSNLNPRHKSEIAKLTGQDNCQMPKTKCWQLPFSLCLIF